MTGVSHTGHPRRRWPTLRSFDFGGLDHLQLVLTGLGALFFLSAIVIAVGPIDPISPDPVAGADDDQLASGNDPGSTSSGSETATPESTTVSAPTGDAANGSSDGSSPDTGAVDDDGSYADDDTVREDETGDDTEQVPTFEKLKEERKSLEREHRRLKDEHNRLKRGQTSEEMWERHQEQYEAHRERFREHRAVFEAYVERYGSDKETVKHRQWLEKVGAKHTIHDIKSERD